VTSGHGHQGDGVEGKLLESEVRETQDFLLINHDVFFSPNTKEYLEFSRE
jgi:hypothetical protein